ncbi:hypothetical protein BJ878DRAFT_116451 [Calycina marina]|uniref:F-box domain-containing protein n=1 Tax=Calycina marina TaxID=1763456 RepID=A0A9P8CDV7_9HELO|nr:hypothetical protein BJ878DRAFT_116451 [Calycina marina]
MSWHTEINHLSLGSINSIDMKTVVNSENQVVTRKLARPNRVAWQGCSSRYLFIFDQLITHCTRPSPPPNLTTLHTSKVQRKPQICSAKAYITTTTNTTFIVSEHHVNRSSKLTITTCLVSLSKGLNDMPAEILIEIFGQTNYSSLPAIKCTSKYFREAMIKNGDAVFNRLIWNV